MMGLTTSSADQKVFYVYWFLIHLQNFIVNQIHLIGFGGGYTWEGRLWVDRPITCGRGGGLLSILSTS